MTLGEEGWGKGIAMCKFFIKPKMNQIGAKVGNNEFLKTSTKTFKFQVCHLNLKVKVMKADVADKNFGPVLCHDTKYKNSAEGVIAPAGAKVTGATIWMWLLNKFISFLAVLTWKTGLKKMCTKCLVGHIYSRPVLFPLMAISSALTFRIIQPNDNGMLT